LVRLEVYGGVKQHLGTGPQRIDTKSGPAAVLRNLEQIIPTGRRTYHVVAIDRFYTSVPLLMDLLSKKVYAVGTIQTSRVGFAKSVIDKRKNDQRRDAW
ncbi:hypothetical protein PHYSODRAFT_515441, partial [Phytophthora sojae]